MIPLTSLVIACYDETILLPAISSVPNGDRPVVIAGSGRCGSTLLQSILNTNPDFLIWGEHNGFLRQIASAFYDTRHPRFPDQSDLDAAGRIKKLRDGRGWSAWDNLCGEAEFQDNFRNFIRSFFADPTGRAQRWGFKEIRYPGDASDHSLRLMFECFPETRMIVLTRLPEPTIFSMLSHWTYMNARQGNIQVEELDRRILAAANLWSARYSGLDAFAQAHPSNCLRLRYEDLGSPDTYQHLSDFLAASSFDYQTHLAKVKDASNKTDATAVLIRRRIELLQPQIAEATCAARAAYSYSGAHLEQPSAAR